MQKERSNFTGNIGFVLAAAGSAVGLGNIWRFPYLAAKDGGGLFLLCYLVLLVTFGFTLLTTEIAIGRKTLQGPLTAYRRISESWWFLGLLACLIPMIIVPYYCAVGGWVLKYAAVFLSGQGLAATADGYFVGFITSVGEPIGYMLAFLAFTVLIVFGGVEKGIERFSKILMPILFLMIVCIAAFSISLSYTDADGSVRTGVHGLWIYLVPNFDGLTLGGLLTVMMDALGQLFYSISVAMGIMIAYGSYMSKKTPMMQAINHIEFFDTFVAVLAGMMIIPAVYTFMGMEGMTAGPGMMFVLLPKVFEAMGGVGQIIGIIFFVMVAFAAVTSSVSLTEAVVASVMDRFNISRNMGTALVSLYIAVVGVIVCLGYNHLYVEVALPNGSVGQILDIMDYVSNNCMMPILALLTCILVGWVAKPQVIIEEILVSDKEFKRQKLYVLMVRYIAPFLLVVLMLQALGLVKL